MVPAPKSMNAKFYPRSEKTPQHVEVTGKSATVDLFISQRQVDKVAIHTTNGHSIVIKPRYGTSDCLDGSHCEEVDVTTDNTTLIEKSLDGQPMGRSRFWEIRSANGGPTTYQACSNGAIYSGRSRSEVEAVLATPGGKETSHEDMVVDPNTGLPAPPGVLAQATPLCDWAEREKKLREAIEQARKAAASEQSNPTSKLLAPVGPSQAYP